MAIYQINKYHRVEQGETCSSVKVEKVTDHEAYEEALKQYFELAKNYMADSTVLAFSLAIMEPKTQQIKKREIFTKYVEPTVVEEPQVVETTEEVA